MLTTASRLDELLAPGALSALFQMIFEWRDGTWRPHSVEGLVRGPAGTHFETPAVLFEYMRLKHAEPRADLAGARAVLAAAARLPAGLPCSLNVHAATLSHEPEFLVALGDLLNLHAIEPERVTLEIVEHAPESALHGLTEALVSLRHIGTRLALDHVGRGQSNFELLLQIRPDYLKLDRGLVAGVHADAYRMALVEATQLLAHRVGARVIAVGVDDAADLETLQRLGVELFQGHLLARAVPVTDLAGVLAGPVPV